MNILSRSPFHAVAHALQRQLVDLVGVGVDDDVRRREESLDLEERLVAGNRHEEGFQVVLDQLQSNGTLLLNIFFCLNTHN